MLRGTRRRFLSLVGAAAVAGCTAPRRGRRTARTTATLSHEGSSAGWRAPADSPLVDVSLTALVENLAVPWDLAFAPNGDLFVTERVGRISRYTSDDLRMMARPREAIDAGALPPGSEKRPWWVEGGEGGTMGVAVHPNYPSPPFVYVYYTARVDGDRRNRLVRYDAGASNPTATETVLLGGVPASKIHNGGRIAFGPENYLWITTGDAGEGTRSQDAASLAGKVLRLTPEGDPVSDNPDLPDGDPRVFTYGHRNPQGLAWLPDGTPVATEHGPSGKDEVNRLEPGANYGWPDVRAGGAYRSTPEVHPPLVNTGDATWAPSGCTFYTGDAVPAWRNRLVVGTLRGQHVNVITLTPPGAELPPLDGDARRFDAGWLDDAFVATSHRVLENALGRVRLVTEGPDGGLYAVTSNRDGRAGEGFPTDRDDVLVRIDRA